MGGAGVEKEVGMEMHASRGRNKGGVGEARKRIGVGCEGRYVEEYVEEYGREGKLKNER